MPIIRMFSAECDSCSNNDTGGYWYKSVLMAEMKAAGWQVKGDNVTCPECQES